MPIEQEYKFVLHSAQLLEREVRNSTSATACEVTQGYLGGGNRVRRKIINNGSSGPPQLEHLFTYKKKLVGRPGCLEIECNITADDFDLAWPETKNRVTKTRYAVSVDDGVWEFDFFRYHGSTYFAMAEFEVPPGGVRPSVLHPLVQKYLLYSVADNDDRFTNRKLSDITYAAGLIMEIAKNGKTAA